MSQPTATSPLTPCYDALIIGAGISGLTLGLHLKAQQKKFLILEKSKGVGGRIATRRVDEFTFDHGAQFLKCKLSNTDSTLPRLKEKVPPLGLLEPWFEIKQDICYAKAKGFTQIAKAYELSEYTLCGQTILQINKLNSQQWEVISVSGSRWITHQVYLSAPLPQSLKLLSSSGIPYPQELNSIFYASACVGLFGFADSSSGECYKQWPSYVQDVSDSIFSMSNQQSKGVSKSPALTVVMRPEFSHLEFENKDESILQKIESALCSQEKIKIPFELCKLKQLKKWRYSHPLSTYSDPFLALENDSIFLIGDAFGGGSIHGALRSALSLSRSF